MKQLVFIDDSGDPGIDNSPSEFLSMTAILFENPKIAELTSREISNFRKNLGWADNCEFKFRKTNKKTITELLELASKQDFAIYSVYIKKNRFRGASPIVDTDKLMLWLIGELLRSMPLTNAKIEIDRHFDKQTERRRASYLRKFADPGHTKRLEIKYEDSKKDTLIQLADLAAGSINRHLNADKTDCSKYFNIIRTKVQQIEEIK